VAAVAVVRAEVVGAEVGRVGVAVAEAAVAVAAVTVLAVEDAMEVADRVHRTDKRAKAPTSSKTSSPSIVSPRS
jgi:hypothetical protein